MIEAPAERVLVIGYGNALRSDDGIGCHVAERLAEDPRFSGVAVQRMHQLAPEHALDFSHADLVVLVDASYDQPAGVFAIEPLAAADAAVSTWSHHVSPEGLMALAVALYGHCAPVFLVGVGVASVEVGEQLSPSLEAAVPQVVDAVAAFIAECAGAPVVATHA